MEPKTDGYQKESPLPGVHFRFHVTLRGCTLVDHFKEASRSVGQKFHKQNL